MESKAGASCRRPSEFPPSVPSVADMSVPPTFNPEGGIILNSRDITHQKMAEKTLLAKQDALVRNREELEALAARLFRKQEEERRRGGGAPKGNLAQTLAAMRPQEVGKMAS